MLFIVFTMMLQMQRNHINILPDLLHSEIIGITLESLKEFLSDIIVILDEVGELLFLKED